MTSRRPCIHPAKRLKIQPDPVTLMRFLKKVKVVDRGYKTPCWIWKRHKDGNGYAQFSINSKPQWAHRASYAMFVRTVPEGKEVDHVCHNSDCVCPWHLVARSVAANRRDVWRGRRKQGKGDYAKLEDLPV